MAASSADGELSVCCLAGRAGSGFVLEEGGGRHKWSFGTEHKVLGVGIWERDLKCMFHIFIIS